VKINATQMDYDIHKELNRVSYTLIKYPICCEFIHISYCRRCFVGHKGE